MKNARYIKALRQYTTRFRKKIHASAKRLSTKAEPLTRILQKFKNTCPLNRLLANTKRGYLYLLAGTGTALLIGLLVFNNFLQQRQLQAALAGGEETELGSFPITIPTVKYGFALDTFLVTEGVVQPNEFLGSLLQARGLNAIEVQELVQNAEGIFDIRQLRAGKPYTFLAKAGKEKPDYFIYEPNVYVYYVFDLQNKTVQRIERPIQRKWETAAGTIETSLWNAMAGQGLDYALIAKMEDALQWSVDFHHLQKDDRFQLLYEQEFINGEPVGIGRVYAARYQTANNDFFAIWYDQNEKLKGYYDLEGRPMNKGFLKAPVKFSRISSRFNPSRLHPILKRRRPHLGTDYAAPHGTPIMAVGNGVVVQATYSKGGGYFVKIKHDKHYTTRYLHMQGFAKGIHPGATVSQGQIIGYVGATGLATGPHVHFEFLKDGKHVDHTKLQFPPPEPLPESELPNFFKVRDQYLKMMGVD